jgi:hypothetical protein
MSLRRELRAVGGFAFGSLGLFLAFVHRGDLLVAPFAAVGAALLLGAVLAIRERPRAGSRLRRREPPRPYSALHSSCSSRSRADT